MINDAQEAHSVFAGFHEALAGTALDNAGRRTSTRSKTPPRNRNALRVAKSMSFEARVGYACEAFRTAFQEKTRIVLAEDTAEETVAQHLPIGNSRIFASVLYGSLGCPIKLRRVLVAHRSPLLYEEGIKAGPFREPDPPAPPVDLACKSPHVWHEAAAERVFQHVGYEAQVLAPVDEVDYRQRRRRRWDTAYIDDVSRFNRAFVHGEPLALGLASFAAAEFQGLGANLAELLESTLIVLSPLGVVTRRSGSSHSRRSVTGSITYL
ncbi:MAG TPA: hypothetical protein DCP91_04405 [Eggerthellaceae bacterium]|nr:hypothetical protein [Eggerthellaceae bacterium]